MPRVVVVGSVNVDFVVRVARLPAPGETVTGGAFERHGGGKGANQALAAAHVGADTRLIAAVGDDEPGRSALGELAAGGVDVSGCRGLPGVPTGIAVIVVDAAGENQIAVASGANGRLDAATVEQALSGLEAPDRDVVLTGFEVPDEAVIAAARWAARTSARLVLNPAPARPVLQEIIACAPILTPNRSEATALTGEDDPVSAARALGEQTGAPVIVTLGSDGALLLVDGRARRIPALDVDPVDATGAGDALNGVLAAELARGSSLEEALRWAVAAASLSTCAPGARAGLPTRAAIGEALVGHRD